jgi:hypothetical protein
VNEKLSVLVRVDLEGAWTRIKVKGRVNPRNVQVLYVLARRANALSPGHEIAIDLSAAPTEPDTLAPLSGCAVSERLPSKVDPAQAQCRLRIIAPAGTRSTSNSIELAA